MKNSNQAFLLSPHKIPVMSSLLIILSHFLFFAKISAVPTKVKKTDLPVLPPESEILPSLDDSEDNFSDDLDNDDEDLEDQDEMVVDEPLDTLEEEEEEDEDYESEEDVPALDSDFSKDGEKINFIHFKIINFNFIRSHCDVNFVLNRHPRSSN